MYGLLQALRAVPVLDSLTLTIKLHESRGKAALYTKVPEVADETERGTARRRIAETAEDRSQAADDLVQVGFGSAVTMGKSLLNFYSLMKYQCLQYDS